MGKTVHSGKDAVSGVMEGITLAARIASITIGPMGRYVVADRAYGVPIMRDAVSAIRALSPMPHLKGMGIAFVRDLAVQTSDIAGDGTATASILFHALMREGQRYLASGVDAGQFTAILEAIAAEATHELERNAKSLGDNSQLERLATNAANGDSVLGRLAARAVSSAGNGMVLAQVANRSETTMVTIEGIRVELAPICTELAISKKVTAETLYNPIFYLFDGVIDDFGSLVPVIEMASKGRPLVVVAENILGAARAGLVLNRSEDVARIFAFKAAKPSLLLKDLLADLSAATGASVYRKEFVQTLGIEGAAGTMADLQLHFDRNVLLIQHPGPRPVPLEEHCKGLRTELVNTSGGHKALEQRLANLEGRSVVINVGGHTEIEAKEARDRISTALRAVAMVRKSGAIVGGGVSLLQAMDAVRKQTELEFHDPLALKCISRALEEPAAQIIKNAGYDPAPILAQLRNAGFTTVFDVTSGTLEECHTVGLYDSAGVVICALTQAVSMAALLLNSQVFITNNVPPVN
ncbi:TCP-1/cpn60 chaperonin family protein [Roseibium sp. M-1]